MVPDQPNMISPCSFNRLPWAGGFELPGLCCSQAGDAVFQGNRQRKVSILLLNWFMSDMSRHRCVLGT